MRRLACRRTEAQQAIGLRVVDASIMPAVTGANAHAAEITIAERAADFIRADDRSAACVPRNRPAVVYRSGRAARNSRRA